MPVKRTTVLLLAASLAACEIEPEHGLPLPPEDVGSGGGVSDVAPVTGGDADADAGQPEPDCLDGVAENDLGVGRRCEAGGEACDGTARVSFCSLDFLDGEAVALCTFPCNDSSECGDGAVCAPTPEDPEGTHCWPAACVEEGVGGY